MNQSIAIVWLAILQFHPKESFFRCVCFEREITYWSSLWIIRKQDKWSQTNRLKRGKHPLLWLTDSVWRTLCSSKKLNIVHKQRSSVNPPQMHQQVNSRENAPLLFGQWHSSSVSTSANFICQREFDCLPRRTEDGEQILAVQTSRKLQTLESKRRLISWKRL